MPDFNKWSIVLTSLAEYLRVVQLDSKDKEELANTLDKIAKEILAYL